MLQVNLVEHVLHRHSSAHSHIQCQEQAVTFVAVMERKIPTIKSHLDAKYEVQIQQNTQVLLAIVDVIQFLTKQGIALRGHSWHAEERREDGNFSTLINFVANYNPELNAHLQKSAKNARYLSPKIQNELIGINGSLICDAIVKECNNSLFWSVMVDKATDVSNVEQASICVRYVSIKSEKAAFAHYRLQM